HTSRHPAENLMIPTLIGMNDGHGPLIEVEMRLPDAREAAAGAVIKVVDRGFEEILKTLRTVVVPFCETWKDLSKEVDVSESTLKMTLGVTAEGNFYIAKGNA